MNGAGNYDRRDSARLDMEKQIISISWNEGDEDYSRDVMCFDVSGGGFQIEMEKPLPIGTRVSVLFSPYHPECRTYAAEVLRLTRQEHGWFNIGLQFTNKS